MDIRDKVHSYILEEEIVKLMGVKIQFQDTSNTSIVPSWKITIWTPVG
jgi:hypothetical protein